MNETNRTGNCERAGELVAYFYGEASRAERENFDTHLAGCVACRGELAAFAEVRDAVGNWRAEILNGVPALSSTSIIASPSARREHARRDASRRHGALAAIREFFNLSPVWLRAGVAASAFVICALAALAVFNAEIRWDGGGLAFSTRLRSETKRAPSPQIAAPAGKVYTQAELDKLVAERDVALRELEDTRAQLDNSREANLIAAVETLEPTSASRPTSTQSKSRRERRASPAHPTRPKQGRDERDEEDLPRLYDLLSEAN